MTSINIFALRPIQGEKLNYFIHKYTLYTKYLFCHVSFAYLQFFIAMLLSVELSLSMLSPLKYFSISLFPQIVMNVFQGVSSHCPCTWEDVLLFRRNHIGYPDHAVQSLIYYKNQLQYQSRRIQGK